jgi:hypothetical protein
MNGVLPLALLLGAVTIGVLLLRNRNPSAAELADASEDRREAIWGRCPLCGGVLDIRPAASRGVPGKPGSGGVHDEVYCPTCGLPEREARERREAGLW